jgi:hypothetical protein
LYKIQVLHNYLYKLVAELRYRLPDAMYRVRGDTIITHDKTIVDIAESIFQFQPGLLVVDHSVPRTNIEMGRGTDGDTW